MSAPLSHRLLSLGDIASRLVDEYAAKVKNYAKFEEVQIRPNPKNSSNPEVQKAAEGAASPPSPPPPQAQRKGNRIWVWKSQ